MSQVTVNVPFTAPTDSDFALNITGSWTFNGLFTLASGRQFVVSGSGSSVTVAGTTNLNGANVVASSGATLSFPNVTSYTSPAGLSVNWIAQSANSLLVFPNLTTITCAPTPSSYLTLLTRYDGTATISLPALTTITKADDGDPYADSGVQFTADGNGLITAPNLSAFNDSDPHPNSALTAYGAGTISLPKLLAPKGVNINFNAASHPEQFTSLVGTSSFQLNAGTVTMSNLANASFNAFSSILVGGGATLSFPNVTSYTSPAGLSVNWIAQSANSLLVFPNLTTITCAPTPSSYLTLLTRYDGTATISLPALTTITKADDGDPYADSGVQFTADGNGLITAPNLSAFNDSDPHPNSALTAYGAGTISLPKLLAPKGVNINFNAASHPEQFTSLVGTSSFQLNAGTVTMSNLANASFNAFSSILVGGGATLSFPNVTSYTSPAGLSVNWIAQSANSLLVFPNLTTITCAPTPSSYLTLLTRYDGTATISLPALTTITKADDGDPYADSGVQFTADGNGLITAPNLSAFNDSDPHPNSALTAYGAGTISLPKLLAPKGVNINFNAASHPEQFTSLVGTSSFQLNAGTVTMSNLANASFNAFSSILVGGGATLSFPNVTSYTSPAGLSVNWIAQQAGSTLTFPNLANITGPITPGTYLTVRTQYNSGSSGALVSFPALTTISKADDGDQYADSGVQFFASDYGVISAPNLSSFQDNDSHPLSSLNVSNGGGMVLTSLTQSGIRGVALSGVTLPAGVVPPPLVKAVVLTNGTIKVTVPTLTGHTYQLQQTLTLSSTPNWQNVGSAQSGTNAPMDFTTTAPAGKCFFRIMVSPWP